MSSTTEAVIQMLLGGQAAGGVSPASLSDQLEALAQRDARVAPLVQHLQERLAAKNRAAETTEEEERPVSATEPEIVEPVRSSQSNQELKSVARRMFAELKTLRARNDMLAQALGACHLCWGEDLTCPYCAGDGHVGAFVIKAQTFEDVVGPAMQQVRQRPPLAKPTQSIHKGERNHAI